MDGGAVEAALPQQLHEVLGLHEVHQPLAVAPVLVGLLGHGDEVLDEVLDDEGAAGLVELLYREIGVDEIVEVAPRFSADAKESRPTQWKLAERWWCMYDINYPLKISQVF